MKIKVKDNVKSNVKGHFKIPTRDRAERRGWGSVSLRGGTRERRRAYLEICRVPSIERRKAMEVARTNQVAIRRVDQPEAMRVSGVWQMWLPLTEGGATTSAEGYQAVVKSVAALGASFATHGVTAVCSESCSRSTS